MGRDPVVYYDYSIGHILHLRPDEVGEVTYGDLMGALGLFDALYRAD